MWVNKFLRLMAFFVALSLGALHFPHVARAELIGVQTLLQSRQRFEHLATTQAFLEREEVRNQLIGYGVALPFTHKLALPSISYP